MNDIFEKTEVAVSKTGTELKALGKDIEMNIIDQITNLKDAGLVLPEGYNHANAIKAAWLVIQNAVDKSKRKVIDVCSQASIANAILSMILKGENIVYGHGYFIPYGNELTYMEDYRGKLMRAIRDTNIVDVNAQVIYEGDNFVYEVNRKGAYQLVAHETKFENIDINKIKGGYAVVTYKDGSEALTIMTIEQIRKAWGQGAANGVSGAHKNFTDEMVKKTVIGRAIKIDLGKASETMNIGGDDDEERDLLKDERDSASNGEGKSVDIPETEYEDVTGKPEAGESKKRKEDSPI